MCIRDRFTKAYYNRGILYKELGELEKGILDFNRTIELNTQHAEAYNNRGLLYLSLGEINKAILDHEKSIEINPNNAQAYGNLGIIYQQKGNIFESKKYLKQAANLFLQQGLTNNYRKTMEILQQF